MNTDTDGDSYKVSGIASHTIHSTYSLCRYIPQQHVGELYEKCNVAMHDCMSKASMCTCKNI